MSLEEEILSLLNERRKAINTFRSRLQHLQLNATIPPELTEAAQDFYDRRVLCNSCEPELVMIADNDYYNKHRDELARRNGWFDESPVAFGHRLSPYIQFKGIRGMKFSILDQGRHVDCVELDAGTSKSYFDGLDDKGKEEFLHYYFSHIRQDERYHLNRIKELYIAFMSRDLRGYFAIEKVVRTK